MNNLFFNIKQNYINLSLGILNNDMAQPIINMTNNLETSKLHDERATNEKLQIEKLSLNLESNKRSNFSSEKEEIKNSPA